MFAPYGTLIDDPNCRRPAANRPGTSRWRDRQGTSRKWVDDPFLVVPKYTTNGEPSLRFIQMACSKQWMRRSVSRGNVRPMWVGAARPRDGEAGRWSEAAAKSIETGIPTPTKPIFPASERSLRAGRWLPGPELSETGAGRDRKSTRLNSSHVEISYAVFCLKKKKKKNNVIYQHKKKTKQRHEQT